METHLDMVFFRLLTVSQILLNDASERGQKIKVVATLRNGLSAKEFANFIASERHEKVRGRP